MLPKRSTCRCAEEADVDASALQPVAKNLTSRYDGIGGFRQLTVADGQRQYAGLGTDRAGFVDQHDVRQRRQPRQVGRFRRQADANEAHTALFLMRRAAAAVIISLVE